MSSAETTSRAAWEDLNITRDELNRISTALKNEEFRKLLVEYAEELNDPANKKLYEEEIKELEKERGVDCTFINPEPGYVIKTSIDGKKKAFINVCKNDFIGKPTSSPSQSSSGARGLTWSLPYSQAPPREDFDKKSARCTVFDVVFHPDTHHLAENNPQFKNMLNDTAMDAVESSFQVKLDRKNVRYPKMVFKGTSHPAVIRKKSSNPPAEPEEGFSFPSHLYPPTSAIENPAKIVPKKVKETSKAVGLGSVKQETEDSPYTTPKYTIKYRSAVDIQDFTNDRNAKANAAIPTELIVSIFLPLLRTTADVALDVHEKWIQLKSTKTAKYFLNLPLPYAVNDQSGNAIFDQKERKLVITLPVVRTNKNVVDFSREDSGVESDMGLQSLESDDGIEKEEIVSKVGLQVLSECVNDEPERTMPVPTAELKSVTFLNPDIHYSLTPVTCNVVDSVIAFTLHVKNVDPDSVHHLCLNSNSIHVRFSSVGTGFFPLHYAFYVKLPADFTFTEDETSVETWDNNVIVQLTLNPCDSLLTEYYFGIDEASSMQQDLQEPTAIKQRLTATDNADEANSITVQVTKSTEEEVVVEITGSGERHDEGSEEEDQLKSPSGEQSPRNDAEKMRCYSESSGEELSSSLTKRGILKYRSVSRSLSESNVDDFSYSSSLDAFPQSFDSDQCILEEGTEEEIAAKKTARVRFSEVIAKKTFRINSSILGQKKKTERKMRNKKRAQERRASESETSEGDCDRGKASEGDCDRGKASEGDCDGGKTSSSGGGRAEVATKLGLPAAAGDAATELVHKCQAKNTCKSKKKTGKGGKQKHASLNIEQLGFKNDLIFDLDM